MRCQEEQRSMDRHSPSQNSSPLERRTRWCFPSPAQLKRIFNGKWLNALLNSAHLSRKRQKWRMWKSFISQVPSRESMERIAWIGKWITLKRPPIIKSREIVPFRWTRRSLVSFLKRFQRNENKGTKKQQKLAARLQQESGKFTWPRQALLFKNRSISNWN